MLRNENITLTMFPIFYKLPYLFSKLQITVSSCNLFYQLYKFFFFTAVGFLQ